MDTGPAEMREKVDPRLMDLPCLVTSQRESCLLIFKKGWSEIPTPRAIFSSFPTFQAVVGDSRFTPFQCAWTRNFSVPVFSDTPEKFAYYLLSSSQLREQYNPQA